VRVTGRPPFHEHRISTEIYPGFPTDLQAPFSLALVEADGVSTIKENLYEDRFDYAAALQQMGANIHVFDAHTAAVYGPCQLHGSEVEIPDLRAGATLVLAALAAEGVSRITGIEHVARGYEDMVGKLSRAGARITEEHASCPSPSNN
jgi:UDP-N-acetylglucosamine 1-carboxyvinyltransferase